VTRLVAVLGFSTWRGDELHPICLDRLRAAELAAADGAEAVLLSGWSRRPHRISEAELMRRAWQGRPVRLLVDVDARTTAGNARAVATAAATIEATEVVVVTSSWHARRARHLVSEALPQGVLLRVATPGRTRPARHVTRELALYLLRRTTGSTARALRRAARSPRRSPRA
jgi:uncharacterized SAM-binding protein YcdF (DUF218 family)